MGWIGTVTGKRVDFLDPKPEQIDIEDIATGLSNVCRFAGQTDKHYSVAQHCVLASCLVEPQHALAALLHDASEAYTGDCTRPLKRDLGEAWTSIEDALTKAIFDRFGLGPEIPAAVKTVDNRLCVTERNTFQPNGPSWSGHWLEGVEPYQFQKFEAMPASEARDLFLERFAQLNILPMPGVDNAPVATVATVEPVAPKPDANGFVMKDSGARASFASGMVRDIDSTKTDFTTVFNGPMLDRWAALLTKAAASKYKDLPDGTPNWMLANGPDELARFRKSATRHFRQWLRGDRDEDHAAAVLFNVNGAEYVRDRMNATPTLAV